MTASLSRLPLRSIRSPRLCQRIGQSPFPYQLTRGTCRARPFGGLLEQIVMTGHHAVAGHLAQDRPFRAASLARHRTADVKAAALRWIERARQFALQDVP